MPTLRLTDAAVKRLRKPDQGRTEYWDSHTRGFGLRYSASGVRSWVVITRSLQAGHWQQQRVTLGQYPALSLAEARQKAEQAKTLAKQGDSWKATKPANFTADDSKVTTITTSFSEWKGNSFAEDGSPKTTGLAKPAATIIAKSSVKGHGCQLKVGSETTDKSNYYVETPTQPDIVLVPKWSVDRIIVKLDELKKK